MVLILLMTKTCLSLGVCQRSHSEDALISGPLVFCCSSGFRWKGRWKGGGTEERSVALPRLPAEETLLEQGCGNAKASSQGLSGAPKASLAGCKQRGLWEITRDYSGRLMPWSSGTFSSRNSAVGQPQRGRERERNLSQFFFSPAPQD